MCFGYYNNVHTSKIKFACIINNKLDILNYYYYYYFYESWNISIALIIDLYFYF